MYQLLACKVMSNRLPYATLLNPENSSKFLRINSQCYSESPSSLYSSKWWEDVWNPVTPRLLHLKMSKVQGATEKTAVIIRNWISQMGQLKKLGLPIWVRWSIVSYFSELIERRKEPKTFTQFNKNRGNSNITIYNAIQNYFYRPSYDRLRDLHNA